MINLGEWECANCGYIHDGEVAPAVCPDCGASANRFVFYAFPDDSDWEFDVDDLIALMKVDAAGAST